MYFDVEFELLPIPTPPNTFLDYPLPLLTLILCSMCTTEENNDFDLRICTGSYYLCKCIRQIFLKAVSTQIPSWFSRYLLFLIVTVCEFLYHTFNQVSFEVRL